MSASDESGLSRLDVGMVTWNTKELSLTALRRIIDVTKGLDVRILVRDNGSSDGTAEGIAAELPEVDLDAGRENLGFGMGVNTLFARSDAPWFLLINSDAWPEPDAIERMLDTARVSPRAAVVAPKLVGVDDAVEESTLRFPSLRLVLVQLSGLYRWKRVGDRFLVPSAWRFDRRREVDWAVGAAWLVRRDALQDVGGFDERYVMYVEDLDWCWRAAARGWRVVFEPQAVVRHVGNASGAQRYGSERTAIWLHNTYFFYREAHGRASALAFRFLNVALAARLWLVARLRRDHSAAQRWSAHLRGSARRSAPPGAMRPGPLQDEGALSN